VLVHEEQTLCMWGTESMRVVASASTICLHNVLNAVTHGAVVGFWTVFELCMSSTLYAAPLWVGWKQLTIVSALLGPQRRPIAFSPHPRQYVQVPGNHHFALMPGVFLDR
jgi:hypothetical protein